MCRRERRRTHNLLVLSATLALGCGGAQKIAPPKQDCSGGKIWHSDDAGRLRGCTHVTGDLHIGGALDAASDLQGLVSVEGDLVIGPSYQFIDASALSSLERVGGTLRVAENWRLQGLFLGSLQTVGGALEVVDNASLATCALHTLRSFGALRIEGNRQLQRLDLSGLDEDGPVGAVGGPSLEDVLAPARIQRSPKASAETRAKGS